MEAVAEDAVLVVLLGRRAGRARVGGDVALDLGEKKTWFPTFCFSLRSNKTHVDHQPEEVADEEDGDDGDEDVRGLLPLPPDQHLAAHVPDRYVKTACVHIIFLALAPVMKYS